MATAIPNPSSGSVSPTVLPWRPRNRTVLDAASALELAVLGATACRLTPLEKIAEQVRCLTGDAWHPPYETILHTIQAATAAREILPTESWTRSIPFFYTLTPTGAAKFRALMSLPLPGQDDPSSRACAEVKFGLLDLAEAADRRPVAADLRRFYGDCRSGIEADMLAVAADRRLLRRTIADRIDWLEMRLATLAAIAGNGTEVAGGPPEQISPNK